MTYQAAIKSLKAAARRATVANRKDRKAIRQAISKHADFLCREIDHATRQGIYSTEEGEKHKAGIREESEKLQPESIIF